MNGRAKAEFTEFAHSRWPGLVRLGYGLTGDRGLAEDLAQTALVNAYASWPRVRKADDPDAYVRRILLNCFRGGFRKRRVAEELSDSPPDLAIADPALGSDDRASVLAAVATLPPKQREVVLLRYWLDLTEVQAAATLGCSVGNVKSQTARALAKLRVSVVDYSQDHLSFAAITGSRRFAYVVARTGHGGSFLVKTHRVGAASFVVLLGSQQATHWIAYSAAGQVLGSNSFN